MESASILVTGGWQKLSAEEKFQKYTSVLGLRRELKQDRIKQRLKREFPNEWTKFRAVADRREQGDMSDDIYALKNESLQFSLLLTAYERGELHAKAFSLIESISEPVSTILDVGCENGFLTCLLGLRWPDARVVGIDRSAAAVHRARELATNLKLKNITFVVGAAEEIPKNLKATGIEEFDLITTITMLHDAGLLSSSEELKLRTAELFSPIAASPLRSGFSAIVTALGKSSARWISMERCQSPAVFSAWCQALDLVGLGIDFEESRRVPCEDALLTVIVARRDYQRPIDLKKVQGLWISSEFNRWSLPKEPPWVVRDQQAEALFGLLSSKRCIDRIVASDGEGREIQRIEVWAAGSLSLYYSAVHPVAQTFLQIRSITDLAAMRDHWKNTVAPLRHTAPAHTRFEEFHKGS